MKYPEITVNLIGSDGNAFAILANMKHAMQRHKVSREDIDSFLEEAMSGDYNHLLQTCMKWVNVE